MYFSVRYFNDEKKRFAMKGGRLRKRKSLQQVVCFIAKKGEGYGNY